MDKKEIKARYGVHPDMLQSDKPWYFTMRCWEMAIQKAIIFLNHNGFPDMQYQSVSEDKIIKAFYKTIGLVPPTGCLKTKMYQLMDLYLMDLWVFRAYDFGFYNSTDWKELREQVFAKYGRVCCKCGDTRNLHIDHIQPKSHFPAKRLKIGNMQVLCAFCNLSKGNRNTMDYRRKGVVRVIAKRIIAASPVPLTSKCRPAVSKIAAKLLEADYSLADMLAWFNQGTVYHDLKNGDFQAVLSICSVCSSKTK